MFGFLRRHTEPEQDAIFAAPPAAPADAAPPAVVPAAPLDAASGEADAVRRRGRGRPRNNTVNDEVPKLFGLYNKTANGKTSTMESYLSAAYSSHV